MVNIMKYNNFIIFFHHFTVFQRLTEKSEEKELSCNGDGIKI